MGRGALVGESGEKYEWRFPHFELGSPGHIECPICKPIREGSPYTVEMAEALGFPGVPHPNCDHGWVLVPLGADARTEEFPPVAGVPGEMGKMAKVSSRARGESSPPQGFPDMDGITEDLSRRPKVDPRFGHGVAHGLRFGRGFLSRYSCAYCITFRGSTPA